MDRELDMIFNLVGWGNFWDITENGSKLLTIEFLCTLQMTELGVAFFRLFKQSFTLTWRQLSNLLGFPPTAAIDLDAALEDINRHQFWQEFSRDTNFYQPRVSQIEHPTLRFLHKWIGIVFISRDDIRRVRVGDLLLIYAVVKKRQVSPVRLMVEHWLSIPSLIGEITCTSLTTRIATRLNLIEGADFEYIQNHRTYIGYEHFSHAHLLKREHIVLYMLYTNSRIRLPNLGLALYSVSSLLIDFQATPTSQLQPQRSASVRVPHQSALGWAKADPELEEPAHASYDSWGAHNYRMLRNPWEQQTTMPEGEEQWQEHPYHQPMYSYDPYGPSSSAGHSQDL